MTGSQMESGNGTTIAGAPSGAGPADSRDAERAQANRRMEGIAKLLLDKGEYPHEVLDTWAETESRDLMRLAEAQSKIIAAGVADGAAGRAAPRRVRLPRDVREASATIMNETMWRFGYPEGAGQAITLFDVVYASSSRHLESLTTLPMACAAVCRIVLKLQTVYAKGPNVDNILMACSASLTRWLSTNGHFSVQEAQAVFSSLQEWRPSMNAEELKVFEIVSPYVNMPSVESWLNAFCDRLGVASACDKQILDWVSQLSIRITRMLPMHISTLDIAPRQVALGILSLVLIAAKVLPAQALRPSEIVSEKDWGRILAALPPWGFVTECTLSEASLPVVFRFLEISTRSTWKDLQSSAYAIAQVLVRSSTPASTPASASASTPASNPASTLAPSSLAPAASTTE